MDWAAIFTLLLAVATFLLSLVTVFGSDIRRKWMRPRIEIISQASAKCIVRSPRERDPTDIPTPTPTPTPVQGSIIPFYWIKVEVTNINRRSEKAELLEVYVESISYKDSSGSYRRKERHHGFNFCWAWGKSTVFADILPGATKFIHLGHLTKSGIRFDREFLDYKSLVPLSAQDDAVMILAASPRNSEYDYVLEPGTYKLALVIGGKNVETMRRWIVFGFTRDWSDDQSIMQASIGIQVHSIEPN